MLSQHLSGLSYEVYGVSRTGLSLNQKALDSHFSILNFNNVKTFFESKEIHEVYYLPAYHHSSQQNRNEDLEFFNQSYNVHVQGLQHFLEAIRLTQKSSKIFYASSSLVFANATTPLQNEQTEFTPDSFYGLTKLYGMKMCDFYKSKYDIFASYGILYNHESHLRPEQFLSKRIIQYVVKAKAGLISEKLNIGDLDAEVDWSSAEDFVRAFHLVLQQDKANNYIISSGILHKVRDFLQIAFSCANLNYQDFVQSNPNLIQRKPVKRCGDNRLLVNTTGWKPKYDFKALIQYLYQLELNKQTR